MSKSIQPTVPTKRPKMHDDSIADVICSNAADRDKCELFVERLREANNNILWRAD